ncbi:hypothetical protein [Nocardioides perillae]|uniref:Uncharacterized protein n=1 Tax=Nocardioides perillae TaxID=1119534 RepID=A0A7Y9RSU7_9ACTN|nr:hypothetical protein [Nocardioides perillae]NYG55705.1 hypothetical protein [Nocardioides perillae]
MSTADLDVAVPPQRAPHEHEMRLVAVSYDDGLATNEFVCTTCGTTWFS